MAGSDVGNPLQSKYQVFLSFRGPDTRAGFTDYLYHSLIDARISVFRDNEELRVGDRIDGALQQAIDDSRIYMPIFSRTYASSHWCLREITQIVENTSNSKGNKQILPIFFDVTPNDVKLKTPLYNDAMLILERERKLSNELVDKWRNALKSVPEIKGWEMERYNGQGELIKLIVEEVVNELKITNRSVKEHLVGIDDQVLAVSRLLDVSSSGVRLVKICGMGGIGKTTLAKVVFNRVCSQFGKRCCFLEDVREKSRSDGFFELGKKMLYKIGVGFGTRGFDERDHGMNGTEELLYNKKVLIVLDDVDDCNLVWRLLGVDGLYPGSRILITTRNMDIFRFNASKYEILDHAMEVMSDDNALQIFSWHAFNRGSPVDEYNDLSKDIVSTSGKLPLALEVIGAFLYHKPQAIWKETLEKLKIAPLGNVFERLKISYDALTFEQQQIFLDIACFFIGEEETNAFYMWEDLQLFPHSEVDILINMSLVRIVETNKFWMHDQLRNLGREIVCRENRRNPGERSRIYVRQDIFSAMRTEEMKKNVQAMDLDLCGSDCQDVIRSKDIGKFDQLKYLKLNGGTFDYGVMNQLTELRWFSWSDPDQMVSPTIVHLQNVVVLQFSNNHWIDDGKLQILIRIARKLKVLSLESCHNITATPNFATCPNLEKLALDDCSKLRKIDGIGKLKSLINLKITRCCCLVDLAEEIGELVKLRYFSVQGCGVNKLPDYISKLTSLREVHFIRGIDGKDTANSWELPSAIGMLKNLEVLIVNHLCLKGQVPPGIGSLPSLRILNLSHTHVTEIPNNINMLSCLERLELMSCDKIQELPALPTSLTHLQVSSTSLRIIPDLSNLTNLVELYLDDSGGGGGDKLCTSESWQIGRLSKLTRLTLGLHNGPAPTELASLPQLNQLDFFGLDLQTLPHLPLSLQKLHLQRLNSIASFEGLQLPNLMELLVQKCVTLVRLTLSGMRKLKHVQVSNCPMLVEIQFSQAFESLEALCIECCESLGRLSYAGEAGHGNFESANELITCDGRLTLPSRALSKLLSCTLWSCHKIFEVQAVGTSTSMEHFDIRHCPNVRSLGGLENLKNLKFLIICNNDGLRVVEGLDELEVLGDLHVSTCGSLESLTDVSSTQLSDDCYIHISHCAKLLGLKKGFDGTVGSMKNEQKIHSKQKKESRSEQEQEQEQEQKSRPKQDREPEQEQEQESKQRRRQGRVSFLLKIGVAACLSALFLSKALHMNK